jgi:hypothetical protein
MYIQEKNSKKKKNSKEKNRQQSRGEFSEDVTLFISQGSHFFFFFNKRISARSPMRA